MSSPTITKPYITENWLPMKKNHEYIKVVEAKKPNSQQQGRRKSSVIQPNKKNEQRRQSTTTEYVKLADSFRDNLAVGRKQELAKLGLLSPKNKSPLASKKRLSVSSLKNNNNVPGEVIPKRRSIVTSVSSNALKNNNSPVDPTKRRSIVAATKNNSSADMLPKRRSVVPATIKNSISPTDTKRRSIVCTPKNNNSPIDMNHTKRRSIVATSVPSKNNPLPADTINHTKRRSIITSNTKNNLQVDTINNTKRRSIVATSVLSKSPLPKNNSPTNGINQTKRRSIVVKEKPLQQQPRRRTLSSGTLAQEERAKLVPTYMKSTLAADGQRRHSVAAASNRTSPKEGKKSRNEDHDNAMRRKSILAAASLKARQLNTDSRSTSSTSNGSIGEKKKTPIEVLSTRRMSRTENLKDGLPTSPSMAAKITTRRKSLLKQQEEAKKSSANPTTVPMTRKRGKTLPGSLAKPPPVQSIQLPPMKVEPIQLELPKPAKRNSFISNKSCSNKTTPIPNHSTSSDEPKKSLSTRKLKGQSHPISSKPTVTPPLKTSPISAPSPRVRPRSARRKSMGETKTEFDDSRKQTTSAYSNHSRKNSLVDDNTVMNSVPSNQQGKTGNGRMVSLFEKLEALVAEHTIDEAKNSRLFKRSQSHANDLDLLVERPEKIKDALMMWNKEMEEAFSPFPKSPQMAIKFYGHQLSPFEQSEIHQYSKVYFLGQQNIKKHQAMPDNSTLNYGYDDKLGNYKSVVGDHLAYRYEILEELGQGSFGQVIKCLDHKLNEIVAVKLIRNKKRVHAQAKTEIKILSDLIKWDPEDRHHNVKMTDHFYFRNHLCIACECLSMNLYEFIKINNFQGFHIPLIKRFAIQLLRSLSLLAKNGVIHCDLKPENILLKHPNKSTIKVIDFGTSCSENHRVYTYIQSRFYRSPEIILGLDYTKAIDMWSLGCIIAELYTGMPLFPGENEQDQLSCIMEVMGKPDVELIQSSERRHLFFDRRGEPKIVSNSKGKRRRPASKSLGQVLECSDTLFLDFIKQCLEWNPEKRLTPEMAFQHDWITQSSTKTPVKDSSNGEE
ncbi:hypothetical protein G6F62_007716 [Rhizopus arrhizus]|nr:hypothetical protein G6F24_011358 [Rhizopus arrhizus]KAG0782306.1 hypothetical protein G6F21_011186 [Rhizopus arrhizus]KAG0787715.1 hypothetical protein G6F22_007226 [Rhizopus arrhizus]KAG0806065.1 hypothetical protein G6F20_011421 [Rhizopus arrhizus]KAG0836815.1 hypothetical protein G6F19_004039 [Rhizopus arrhizus]